MTCNVQPRVSFIVNRNFGGGGRAEEGEGGVEVTQILDLISWNQHSHGWREKK